MIYYLNTSHCTWVILIRHRSIYRTGYVAIHIVQPTVDVDPAIHSVTHVIGCIQEHMLSTHSHIHIYVYRN